MALDSFGQSCKEIKTMDENFGQYKPGGEQHTMQREDC